MSNATENWALAPPFLREGKGRGRDRTAVFSQILLARRLQRGDGAAHVGFRFVTSVVFLVGPENERSHGAVEKIGGVHVGSRADAAGRHIYVYHHRLSLRMTMTGSGGNP